MRTYSDSHGWRMGRGAVCRQAARWGRGKWLFASLCAGWLAVSPAQPVPSLVPVRVLGDDVLLGGGPDRMTGNVSVLSEPDWGAGARLSLRDVLVSTAGVYAQNPAGQDNAKLSMRGSGISNRLGTRGIRLLLDGVPAGRSDDTNDVSYIDGSNVEHVEVYRGGNAAALGASTLGGAINFVSPTGRTRPGVTLRSEFGSHDYVRWSAAAGQAWDGGADAYLLAAGMETDGARDNAAQRMQRLHLSLGYQPHSRIEHRLFANLQTQRQDMPGPVTLEQALTRPRAANEGFEKFGARLDLEPVRTAFAYRLSVDTASAGRLIVAAYVNRARFETSGTYANLHYDSQDHGMSLRHEWDYNGPGGASQLVWGLNHGVGRSNNATYGPVIVGTAVVDSRTVQFEDIWGRRKTTEIFLTNALQVRSGVTLVGGGVASRASRAGEIAVLNQSRLVPIFTPSDGSATYWSVSPRLGGVVQVGPRSQVYGNVSKSAEPPTNFEFNGSRGNILRPQRAWTVELGTRGGGDRLRWDAAIYRSWVKDELLSVEAMPGTGRYVTGNAPRTVHQGVELSVGGELPAPAVAGRLSWALSYTLSHFRYARDRSFGNNALPGIPRHAARVDATYHHSAGYFFGPYLDMASGFQADQRNTLSAPGYLLWSARMGYESLGGRWLVFLDARNLGDKAYVSASEYLVDAGGRDAPVFLPGAGRALYAGLQRRF